MTTRIITFEERVTEPRGVHALIAGPYGVGKTSLVRKLNPLTTLFIDAEDGGLAIDDVPVPHIRPKTWPNMRDLAVRIAGPNPSFGKNEPYSQEHSDRVGGYLPGIARIPTAVLASITDNSPLCFHH